jgi:hypothetical protein
MLGGTFMSDENPNDESNEQNVPPQEELQQRAQHVWGVLKFFFSGVFLISALVLGFLSFWLFHTFGISGVIVGGVALVMALILLCRHLMTY